VCKDRGRVSGWLQICAAWMGACAWQLAVARILSAEMSAETLGFATTAVQRIERDSSVVCWCDVCLCVK